MVRLLIKIEGKLGSIEAGFTAKQVLTSPQPVQRHSYSVSHIHMRKRAATGRSGIN
jgi:hypothetical protein